MLVKNISGKTMKVRVQGEEMNIIQSNTIQTTLDKANELVANYPGCFEIIKDADAYVQDIVDGGGAGTSGLEQRVEALETEVDNKVDKEEGKGLSTNDYTDADKTAVEDIANKVDKENGKGLSTNDFSDAYKVSLDSLSDRLDAKLNKDRGTGNAGKYLKVGADGEVVETNIEISDLDDVETTNPTEGQILSYNETSEKWENKEVVLTEKDLTLYKSSACAQSTGLTAGVGTDWDCWRFVPVYKGDNLTFRSTGTVSNPYLQVCFIDKNGDFVYSSQSPTVNYTFPQDGYVSFIVHAGNPITLKRGNIFNNLPITDISEEHCTISNVVDVESYLVGGALKTDGTVNDAFAPSWSTYSEVPFKFTDTLINSINTRPSISGYASYVVENGSGTKTAFNTGTIPPSLSFCQNVKVSFCRNAGNSDTSGQYIYKRTPKKTTQQKVNNSKVVSRAAIGDSITAGNQGNTATSYASVCASLVGDRVKLSKLGYRGHTMRASLATTAFNAIPTGVDIITVNFGSNDIYAGSSSLRGDVDEILAKDVSELQDNQSSFESLRLFFEKCRTKFPRAQIYVITAIKRSTPETAEAFNADELKLCKYYSIPVLDAYNECQIRQSDSLYKADGIHPSEAGKQVFGRWLANKINFL